MLLSLLLIRLGIASAALHPDSKLAKNVLEPKREGYCSVRPKLTFADSAFWTYRIDALFIRDGGVDESSAVPCTTALGQVPVLPALQSGPVQGMPILV